MKLLQMEFFKCRRRKILLLALLFLAAQMVWMGTSLFRMEPEELAQGWLLLIYDLALIDAVMLPLTVAALASRNCELEHKGATLKLLETVTTPRKLYGAKLAWGAVVTAGMLLVRTVLMVGLGLVVGFPSDLPWGKLGLSLGLSFGVTFAIYAMQQGLSLRFVNQAVPLAVGIFGSFVGLFSLFFPQWVQRCLLWGYYGVTIQAAMNWDPVTRATDFYWVTTAPQDYLLLLLWLAAMLLLGLRAFVRKEV